MTSLPKLVFSIILILVLIQSGHAKTSTENLIVEKSDILNLKKSTEIEEGDFVEDIQVNLDNFVWIVNLKNGPFPTQEKAKQIALALKKTLGLTLAGLLKEISIVRELKSPKSKNFNQAEFSWAVNFRLGPYNSKDKALQIVQKLKITQKSPENVFLARESSNVKTSKFTENVQTKVSGEIFLTREVNPTKDKTEHLILITTRSNSLNVRKNPSSSSPVVASLLKGSKVPHIEKNASRNSNRNWFYVEYSKGKFGWVSSSYSKKIIDLDSRISQQANLKTIIPEKLLIGKAPTTSQFRELKSVVALLRTELDKIKSDKTGAIEARNRARAKLEVSITTSNKKIRDLQTKTASLRAELDKIKSDKTRAIETAHQANVRALEIARRANAKAKEEKLASIKEFKSLKEKSSAEIKDLQTTTASLHFELDKIKSDQAMATEVTRQATAKAKEEKLASANEKNALKEKINTLRVVLDKFKIDKDKTIQANAKAKEEKLASIKEFKNLKEKSSAELMGLQTTTASLRSELDQIKSDRARVIEANAKAKEEKLARIKEFKNLKEKSSAEIKGLQTTTASLRSELDKIKSEKARAVVEATDQANTKAKEEKLARIKEFKSLKEKSSTEIKALQTTTASLHSELDKIKSDKIVAIEAARQATAKAKEDKLARIKEFKSLKEKSSAEIKALQTTTASLRSKLDEIKSNQSAAILKDLQAATASLRSGQDKMRSEKIRAVEATRKANAKAKEDKLASIKEFENLKEKSTKEIMGLQTTTASLRSELDQIKFDRARVIEANAKAKEEKLASVKKFESLKEKSSVEIKNLQTTTTALRSELDQIKSNEARVIEANAKAKEEKLASIKEFENSKEKSSAEIMGLQTTTASLRSELDQIKSDRARVIEANAKAKEEKLAGVNEKNALKEKINTLRVVLDKFKIDKDKTNQANAKAKEEKLASIKEFESLKEKSSAEIMGLKTTTAFLRSELDKIESENVRAVVEATDQANTKAKEKKLANIKEFESLKEKSSAEIMGLQTTTASLRSELDQIKSDRARVIEAKAKEEKLASIKEFESLKEKSSAEIKDLKTTTASLRSELKKIKSDKARAIKATDQTSAKLQSKKLANAKIIASLKAENKKEIDDLKLITASLQKELQKTRIDEAKSIEASNQANAKIRAGDLRSIEFQNKLKDTVIFLRKELDQVKSDKTRATEATNQTHEKLNAEKLANSDKINRLKKTSDREIKNLNTTIKNLRTVLEKFETEKRKTVETRKSLERKTETERILSTKKINTFKNESTALKLQLDKANLDRIKEIEAINRNDRETQANQRAQENEFNTFKQESEIEIASLRGVTESLRKQLTQLKAEKTRSTQTEILLSSSKNPQEPTDSKRTKRKNKLQATSNTLSKNESDNRGETAPWLPTDIVTSHLSNWAKAWESRNVPLYLSFYSKSFKDSKRSRSKWETHRRRSLKNTFDISIELSNIKAFIYRKNSIKTTFIQNFKSNRLSDIGIKELLWKKDANGWKIIKETWRPQ